MIILLSGILAVLLALAIIGWSISLESGQLMRAVTQIRTALADRHLDAILIGLGGAGTFIGSAIAAVAQNPANWHPQAFGIGFGSLATGVGVLFRLRGASVTQPGEGE